MSAVGASATHTRAKGRAIRLGFLINELGIVVAIAILLAAWTGLSLFQPPTLFPPIQTVLGQLVPLAMEGALLKMTIRTAQAVAVGSLLALLIGILAGSGLYVREGFSKPIITFFQIIPPVIWALFAIIWFGMTFNAVVFVSLAVGFPIVAINVWEGLRNVDVQLKEMAHSVNANRYMVLRHIVLPSVVPYLLGGVRVMVGFAWKVSILAELISQVEGIGYSLYAAWSFARNVEVFALTLWLIVLMWLTEYAVIRPIEARATRWRAA